MSARPRPGPVACSPGQAVRWRRGADPIHASVRHQRPPRGRVDRAAPDIRRCDSAAGDPARARHRPGAGDAARSHLQPLGPRRAASHRARARLQLRWSSGHRQDDLRRSHRALARPPPAARPLCRARIAVDGRDAEERGRHLPHRARRAGRAAVRRSRRHRRAAIDISRSRFSARIEHRRQRAAAGTRVVQRRGDLRHEPRGELRSGIRATHPDARPVRDARGGRTRADLARAVASCADAARGRRRFPGVGRAATR